MAKTKESNRPKRVPISGSREVLTVRGAEELEKEFHLCWVNDYLVEKFKLAGYEFIYWNELTEENTQVGDVRINADSPMESRVSKSVGNGVTGFLMKLPLEYWEEDQAEKAKRSKETEQAMRKSFIENDNGRYGNVQIA
jgi:hypothetical protein